MLKMINAVVLLHWFSLLPLINAYSPNSDLGNSAGSPFWHFFANSLGNTQYWTTEFDGQMFNGLYSYGCFCEFQLGMTGHMNRCGPLDRFFRGALQNSYEIGGPLSKFLSKIVKKRLILKDFIIFRSILGGPRRPRGPPGPRLCLTYNYKIHFLQHLHLIDHAPISSSIVYYILQTF